jgi:hypothetical protein
MIHSRSYTVTFAAPFTLPGLERSYPPGDYAVQVDDEQLDLSFMALRRIATVIMLRAGLETLAWPVQPGDLDAALAGDKAVPSAERLRRQRPVMKS